MRPQLEIGRRISNFDEVKGGLKGDNTLMEARRCLGCGNGFE